MIFLEFVVLALVLELVVLALVLELVVLALVLILATSFQEFEHIITCNRSRRLGWSTCPSSTRKKTAVFQPP